MTSLGDQILGRTESRHRAIEDILHVSPAWFPDRVREVGCFVAGRRAAPA